MFRSFRRSATGLRLAAWMLVGLLPAVADAQLEVLLRGVEPQLPVAGRCARYLFESDEPDGSRSTTFIACVESVPDSGAVVLRLTSGDSLQIRITVHRRLFERSGAELSDTILRVERTRDGELQVLTPEDWRKHPALAPAAPLPVVADSSLGSRVLQLENGADVTARGRFRHEALSEERTWSGVEVTTQEDRRLRLWTMPEAPVLGVVLAEARVRSERIFSEPIPGVPTRGPRVMTYRLKLLEILQPSRP